MHMSFSALFFSVFLSFLANPLNAAEPPPFLIVNNPGYDPGMFSVFCTIFGALHFYEEGNYAGVHANLEKGIYYDPKVGPNWWEYFFEPLTVGSAEGVKTEYISDSQLSDLGWWPVYNMTRERGYELLERYFQLKPFIQEKVDDFVNNHFGNDYMIGVHYRGTDKVYGEARRIPYDVVADAIQQAINAVPLSYMNNYKLFVATDEQHFFDYIQEKFPGFIHTDALRSNNGRPVHTSFYSSNYQKGEDALMDCLLLSKCHLLIRTRSNLSFWSERFNPMMPVVLLQ